MAGATAAASDMPAGAAPNVGHAAVRARFHMGRALRGFRLKPADRLLIAPQELKAGDPSAAVAIYSGQIVLAGRTVHSRGQSMFKVAAPDAAWARAVHGFSWLRHFRDADNAVVRQHARALVSEWLKMRELRADPSAQHPQVAADRVLSWLVHAPLLLAEAEHGYYNRFMRSLARDAQWLEFSARRRSLGKARLSAAIAFATYTLCANTAENDWRRATELLTAALSDSVLGDGTPVTRNPGDALKIVGHLLQLRTAYTARGRASPAALQTALDRLMSFLRLMRHPDGALGLFNGMGASQLGHVAAILAFDDSGTEPPAVARFGGYHRLECSAAVLIADAGSGPPITSAQEAHAGALSFEFSDSHERIVVNCGAAPAGLTALREALRETAAHSTLEIAGTSSARFRPYVAADGDRHRRLIDLAERPAAERYAAEGAAGLALSHQGYVAQHGMSHARRLLLAADGRRLSGADALTGTPKGPISAMLRFHLHPRVAASVSADNTSVAITLSDGAIWRFEAGGLPIALEESIFLGGLASQRRSVQIVVPMPGAGDEVRWSFARS